MLEQEILPASIASPPPLQVAGAQGKISHMQAELDPRFEQIVASLAPKDAASPSK